MNEAARHSYLPLGIGLLLLALSLLLFLQPPSTLLLRLSPDGQLNPDTAAFLDLAWIMLLVFGCLFLLIAASRTVRRGSLSAMAEPGSSQVASIDLKPVLWIALVAFVARCVVGVVGDPSLGDDGARNWWLREWMQDPTFVRSGLWAPGHLYVHALFDLVLRKAEIAGMVLAAGSYAGCILLLGTAAGRTWGRLAAISTSLLAAILPVSMAYGSVSDVNTFFAFLLIASVAAVQRAVHTSGWIWLVVAWVCIALAAWTRFETFLLIPAIAMLLWRKPVVMIVFALLSLVPTLTWNFLNFLSSGDPNMVYNAVRADTGLAVSRVSALFGLLTAAWQALTLPLIVLGALGMIRALKARRGREWMGLLFLHLAALSAATIVSATGNQARYLILAGAILAYYTGVAISGIAQTNRRMAGIVMLVAALAAAFLPSAYPDHRHLWIRSNARLRAVMDCVQSKVPEGNLVWISDEASFMFPSRTQWPQERYFPVSRTDTDIEAMAQRAGDALSVWVCHNRSDTALKQSAELLGLWESQFHTVDRFTCEDYVVLRLERNAE